MHALINNISDLLRWPATHFDFQQLVEGFASKSNREVMKGCVFAVDGWLCMIKVPSEAEVDVSRNIIQGTTNVMVLMCKWPVMSTAELFGFQ